MLGLFLVNEIYFKKSYQKFKLPNSQTSSAATTVDTLYKVLLKARGNGKPFLLNADCNKWRLGKLNTLME